MGYGQTGRAGSRGPRLPADADRSDQLEPGAVIDGRFVVKELIGFGRTGTVYEVRDRIGGRDLALKVQAPQLVANTTAVKRFRRTTMELVGLSHRGIVRVFDVGEDDERGLHFCTMERLHGLTLREFLKTAKFGQGGLPEAVAVQIVKQTVKALIAAHHSMAHRRLNSECIFLSQVEGTTTFEVKVLDFGLAELQSTRDFMASAKILGTIYYMAPEQLAGHAGTNESADVYSVSVLFYELLTGQMPIGLFKAPHELRPDFSEAISDLIMAGLSADPAERPASAAEFLKSIRRALKSERRSAAASGASRPGSTSSQSGIRRVARRRRSVRGARSSSMATVSAVLAAFGLLIGLGLYAINVSPFGGRDSGRQARAVSSDTGGSAEEVASPEAAEGAGAREEATEDAAAAPVTPPETAPVTPPETAPRNSQPLPKPGGHVDTAEPRKISEDLEKSLTAGRNANEGDSAAPADAAEPVAGKSAKAVLEVRQDGTGDATKINDAIARARTGATIKVYRGHYAEAIVLRDTLKIVGQGDRSAVLVEPPKGASVTIHAGSAELQGLTLRSALGDALAVAGGSPVVKNCRLTGGGRGLLLFGAATHVRLIKSVVRDCRVGVLVAKAARLTMSECEVTNHQLWGMTVKDGTVSVSNSVFSDNSECGILLFDSKGTIAMSKVRKTAKSGILSLNSELDLLASTVSDNGWAGVQIIKGGRGRLKDVEILGSGKGGLIVDKGASVTVERGRIQQSGNFGVGVLSDSTLDMTGTNLSHNRHYGLCAHKAKSVALKDCTFESNKRGPHHIDPGLKVVGLPSD